MIVYIPTPITSVEQAEALPPKTVVVNIDERTGDPWSADLRENHPAETLVPIKGDHYIALVPVEAEEETIWSGSRYLYTQTRYVTRWETVSDPSPDHGGDRA